MVEAGGRKLFLNVYAPTARLVIVGAVHISQALAPLARSLDYDVTVVDPRTAFASPERFPDVPLIAEWPDVALPPLNVDHYTAFVAVTHDPKIDDPALLHAFERDCFYIGALGSRKTHAKRGERLQGAGRDGCRHRAHSRADRTEHRRGVAVRNRGRDHGRDHRPVAAAERESGMKFGPASPADAIGGVTVHTLRQGPLVLKKGTTIGAAEVEALNKAGVKEIVVVRLEDGDVSEDVAAGQNRAGHRRRGRQRRARLYRPRQSVRRASAGVLVVDRAAVDSINGVDEAITFATLPAFKPVVRRRDDRNRQDRSVRGRSAACAIRPWWRQRPARMSDRALQDQAGRHRLDLAAGAGAEGGGKDPARYRGAAGAGRRHHHRRAPRAA